MLNVSKPLIADRRPIVLTGATGFIGRAVLRELLNLNLPVRALARRAEAIDSQTAVGWHVGDICDVAVWDRLLAGAGAVIHLASAGVSNLDAIAENLETNLPAFVLLMHAARRHGIRRVVLAGSCFEYGRTGESAPNYRLQEIDPLEPTNLYAATKASISMLAGPLSHDLNIETVILRPFHVYGPGEPTGRLIPSLLHMAREGQTITTTTGEQIRDLVHQDDVARAFVLAARAESCLPSNKRLAIFNIGTGVATKLVSVIRMVAELCHINSDRLCIGKVPHRPGEMWQLVANPDRAKMYWVGHRPLHLKPDSRPWFGKADEVGDTGDPGAGL